MDWIKVNLFFFIISLIRAQEISGNETETTLPKASLLTAEINSANFHQRKGSLLLYFYSPNSARCRRFSTEWEGVAEALKDKVGVGKVNVLLEPSMATTFDVINFPSVVLVKSTSPNKGDIYKGALKAQEIVRFFYRKIEPILLLNSRNEIESFIENWDTTVIGFFEERPLWQKDNSAEWKAFRECARRPQTERFGFGIVTSLEASTQFGITKKPSISLFRKWDSNTQTSENLMNICEWIIDAGTPLIEEFSNELFVELMQKNIPIGTLYLDYVSNQKKSEVLLSEFKNKVGKWRGRMKFLFVKDGGSKSEQIKKLGGSGRLPTFIIQDPFPKHNYPIEDSGKRGLDADKIDNWIGSFLTGKLSPRIKSEIEPSHDHPHVVTLTGSSFNQLVMDRNRDVIVLFHTKWCESCKLPAVIFEVLGEALCDVESLKFAKIDVSQNDLPAGIVLPGSKFPYIKLFRARLKSKPMDYSGSKTSEDLLNWINFHAGIKFDLPTNIDFKEEEMRKKLEMQTIEMKHVTTPISSLYKSKIEL